MKKTVTLATMLLAVGVSSAMAQSGGLNLYWNECGFERGAAYMRFACDGNSGLEFTMNASLYAFVHMNQFASASATIDIMVEAPTLPPWWQTLAGQCRPDCIAITFDPATNTTSCSDIWGLGTIKQVSAIQQGLGGPNRVRVIGLAALPAGSEIPLDPGTELWVCKVQIFRNNTLDCAGCTDAACIVFNESKLLSPSEPQQVITIPAVDNRIYWQYPIVPAQKRTWGAVKNLYR